MSTKLYYVLEATCDGCGRKVRLQDKTGDVEGILPRGWAEITGREWGKADMPARGNERMFADLCPACFRSLPFAFHSRGDSDDDTN